LAAFVHPGENERQQQHIVRALYLSHSTLLINFDAAKSLVTATQNLVMAVETPPEPQLLATADGRTTTAHRTGNALERASTGEEGRREKGVA
jgi:hypothetical protein